MIRTATKTALLSAVVLSSAFVAQSASAALITEWNYNVNSTFSDFSTGPSDTGGTTNDVQGSGTNDVLGGDTTLTWGDNKNTSATGDDGTTSSVSITSDVDAPPQPRLVTNGGFQPGATFSHNNQPISVDYGILDTFQITTQLNLTAAVPADGTMQQLGPITFDSFFQETRNMESCDPDSVSVCDDIFVLTDSSVSNPLTSMQSFTTGGYKYTVTLDLTDGVSMLSDNQCNLASAAPGCYGFTTQEGQNNAFTSRFKIDAHAVPEPGTLAMLGLGLGLIGFGFSVRRRRDEDTMA